MARPVIPRVVLQEVPWGPPLVAVGRRWVRVGSRREELHRVAVVVQSLLVEVVE